MKTTTLLKGIFRPKDFFRTTFSATTTRDALKTFAILLLSKLAIVVGFMFIYGTIEYGSSEFMSKFMFIPFSIGLAAGLLITFIFLCIATIIAKVLFAIWHIKESWSKILGIVVFTQWLIFLISGNNPFLLIAGFILSGKNFRQALVERYAVPERKASGRAFAYQAITGVILVIMSLGLLLASFLIGESFA